MSGNQVTFDEMKRALLEHNEAEMAYLAHKVVGNKGTAQRKRLVKASQQLRKIVQRLKKDTPDA